MDLSFSNYQRATNETAIYHGKGTIIGVAYAALGLCGEAGEVAEKIKKAIRDHDGQIDEERTQALEKELGDVLWYVAQIADQVGIPLERVAAGNLTKLRSRKDRGVLGGSGDDR